MKKNILLYGAVLMFSATGCQSWDSYHKSYEHTAFEINEIHAGLQEYVGKTADEIQVAYGRPHKVIRNDQNSWHTYDERWIYKIEEGLPLVAPSQRIEYFYIKDGQVVRAGSY